MKETPEKTVVNIDRASLPRDREALRFSLATPRLLPRLQHPYSKCVLG